MQHGDMMVCNMVRQTFFPTNFKAILSIPLRSHLPRDRLVWVLTPDGSYTVKSTYKIAVAKSKEACKEGPSNGEKLKSF
nr:hypothetical protein CFP56_77275 [Quercus suber]POE84071.1 hypothetical protein CFP56_32825 [Quercus suber]